MKIITAPEELVPTSEDCIKVFLAGGITGCPDWQKKVIGVINDYDKSHPKALDNLIIYNPRRENFPINDPSATEEQIRWEFNALQDCDIFSIYFCDGDSDQPICMYELGRNLLRMMDRFPREWYNRVIISSSTNYKRFEDVKIQTKLATFGAKKVVENPSPIAHALDIIMAYKELVRCQSDESSQDKMKAI